MFLYLGAGTLGGLVKTGNDPSPEAQIRIGLLPGPIHTDILLPMMPVVSEHLSFVAAGDLRRRADEVSWVVVGWGAHDFYTTTGTYTDLRLGPVWRAALGDASVMRVVLAGPISDTTGMRWIDLTERQFEALVRDIRASFAGDAPVPLDHPGLNGRDAFYPATGRFHLFRTCNVWVGDKLRGIGVRVGIWTPFTWSLA